MDIERGTFLVSDLYPAEFGSSQSTSTQDLRIYYQNCWQNREVNHCQYALMPSQKSTSYHSAYEESDINISLQYDYLQQACLSSYVEQFKENDMEIFKATSLTDKKRD